MYEVGMLKVSEANVFIPVFTIYYQVPGILFVTAGRPGSSEVTL